MDKLLRTQEHNDIINFNFDLSNLGISKKVLDVTDLNALPRTKLALK